MGNNENKPKRPCNRTVDGEEAAEELEPLRPTVGEPWVYVLNLRIKNATNVDLFNGSFRTMPGKYVVYVTETQSNREFQSQVTEGYPEPVWQNEKINIVFDRVPIDEYLLFEVVQLNRQEEDPGTSSGAMVVGRTAVSIPNKRKDFGCRRWELVSLIGSEKKIGGFVNLRMKLTAEPARRNPIRQYLRWH